MCPTNPVPRQNWTGEAFISNLHFSLQLLPALGCPCPSYCLVLGVSMAVLDEDWAKKVQTRPKMAKSDFRTDRAPKRGEAKRHPPGQQTAAPPAPAYSV
jgi:hypothetical protein